MNILVPLLLLLPTLAVAQPKAGSSVAAATSAYRATIAAFNQRESRAYFSGYADQLECFYKRADYPATAFRKDRAGQFKVGGQHLAISNLAVVSASATEVVLIDRGTWKSAKGKSYKHEKVVKLRPILGRWRIVVEASKKTNECFKDVFRSTPVSAKASCKSDLRYCFGQCDADREASPNREMLCLQNCEKAYVACAGSPVPEALERLGVF